MAASTNRKIKNILLLLIGFLLSNCANQLPPGGGEIDKTPPQIIYTFPLNGTTNFSDDYFELEFSEYVDRRSLHDAIFVSPTIDGALDLDWSGKSVRVNFPTKLKENTTYVITIGTDVVDYNNKNRMAESFNFTFSTGNEIDRRIILGKIYDEKPSGILIFAYKLNADTANPFTNKPGYVSQAGNDGSFKLLGLAEGTYRVFAVKDEYRDMLFQPDQDLIGIPYKDITFASKDTLFTPLNFFLTKIDTVKPRLISASMTDRFHILVTLTEEPDNSVINSDNYFIIDSTTNIKSIPVYAYKGNTKQTEMVLVDTVQFPLDHEVYLFADSLMDLNRNVYVNDQTQITLSDKPDTTNLKIYKTDPPVNSRDIDFNNPAFSFYFNDAFKASQIKQDITFQDTLGRQVSFKLKVLDDAAFKIITASQLEPEKDYQIKINLSKFRNASGNLTDTTITFGFKTINGLDFTGITGKIENVNFTKNPILVMAGIDKPESYYKQSLNRKNKFGFDRVQPGKYILWCFYDQDSSNTFSSGYPIPFKPSERFSFYPDTLNLRARWVQTDINFIFK